MSVAEKSMKNRIRLVIKGRVQGVGFRPTVYKHAQDCQLTGWVLNSPQGVIIEAEGEPDKLEAFIQKLKNCSPPQSRISTIEEYYLDPVGYQEFQIRESLPALGVLAPTEETQLLISPDLAICSDCLRELQNAADRRYKYPFINCTNCGPRFTIIKDIPYDREKTTMQEFVMCSACRTEYEDPANRRFHAQPNACELCGPAVSLYDNSGEIKCSDPIGKTIELLKRGKIVAIKGLGGFHIACDATNREAVCELRRRKKRPAKPLAIMSYDIEQVSRYCHLTEDEIALLQSLARPIVLLRKKRNMPIAKAVAPENNYFGVMLPYTPLHYLLFLPRVSKRRAETKDEGRRRKDEGGMTESRKLKPNFLALVMTSGNRTDEPIAKTNAEALRELKDIADYFLMHNREIANRCDDSVVRWIDGDTLFFRRSRGYVPNPIYLGKKLPSILACGADLKNSFCLTRGAYAFPSQYIGDLADFKTAEFYREAINSLQFLLRVNPKIIACDLHPDYISTQYARQFHQFSAPDSQLFSVQHHYAHIASVMAEHNLEETIIGVAFDGLGYGTDGNIWGGEFLLVSPASFQRLGHLKYIGMPGGDRATEEPWRMAFSYLYEVYGDKAFGLDIDFMQRIDKNELQILKRMIDKGINCPLTSSIGRLFDAVSSLLGVCDEITYEGQAAIELEMICQDGMEGNYEFEIRKEQGVYLVEPEKLICGIVDDLKQRVPRSIIAAKFHRTIAEIILRTAQILAQETRISKVALSGGVFQNKIILELSLKHLREAGFQVFFNRQVPPNDGGIALGQVWVAAHLEVR